MRFFFALILSCLSTGVLAGGIRGAYERMFIWYVYQAHIADLDWRDSNVDNIEILRNGFGTVKPHGTMTFNEFIEYVNRPKGAKKGEVPSVSNSRMPEVTKTALELLNKRLVPDWPNPSAVIGSARSYNDLLPEVAKVASRTREANKADAQPSVHALLDEALKAMDNVIDQRLADYERFRYDPLTKAKEFEGLRWSSREVSVDNGPKEPKSQKVVNVEATILGNPNWPDIDKLGEKIQKWERDVFFTDKTPSDIPKYKKDGKTLGDVRSSHNNAVSQAKQAREMFKLSASSRCK